MHKKIYYINGEFTPSSNAKISFSDAGFLYGDGLFETFRFQNNRLFYPEKHLKRLNDAFKIMNLRYDKSDAEIIELLQKMIKLNQIEGGLLRLMITRGSIEGFSSIWEYDGLPNTYISISPLISEPKTPAKIVFFDEKNYPLIRFNPAIKSMNYIGNMKAKKDAHCIGAFEPAFYNKDKIITECAIRNIFFIKGKVLYTPSLDLGVLPGVMRSTIIDIAILEHLKIKECHIHFQDINSFDEAFISSSGIGILECYWDEWKSDYKITKKIKKNLADKLSNW